MKLQIAALQLAVISAFLPHQLFAESDWTREFEHIAQERERALKNATEQINKRYSADLEALERRAAASNDLDAAVKLKEALSRVAASKLDFVGIWTLENHNDGFKGRYSLNADFGFTAADGKRLGAWEVQTKRLILHYEDKFWQDIFELPDIAGTLRGHNTAGQKLLFTRGEF